MLNSFASREKKKISSHTSVQPCPAPAVQLLVQTLQNSCEWAASRTAEAADVSSCGVWLRLGSATSVSAVAQTIALKDTDFGVIPKPTSFTVTSPYAAGTGGDSFDNKCVWDWNQHVKWSFKRKLEHLYSPSSKAFLYVKTFLLQNWQIKPSSGGSFD